MLDFHALEEVAEGGGKCWHPSRGTKHKNMNQIVTSNVLTHDYTVRLIVLSYSARGPATIMDFADTIKTGSQLLNNCIMISKPRLGRVSASLLESNCY